MNLRDLDHIGVAVRSIESARKLFVEALGGKVVHEETVPHLKLRVCKVDLAGTVVELLEGLGGEDVVRRFVEKRGEGIHHLCYSVPDLRAAQKELEKKGYKAIWPEPKMGSSKKLVTFLHPRDTHGVLIELSQT
ncbi:MAG TPA: methylmalonyl-CoA epimerase [Planctomycetota bacterium]|nr:methylmalonyl-CoA epimerase [Planctomycetota bacterium]